MTLEEAKISTAKYKKYDTIVATSDGSIYLNGDIEAIEEHAKEHDLELFRIKPEENQ